MPGCIKVLRVFAANALVLHCLQRYSCCSHMPLKFRKHAMYMPQAMSEYCSSDDCQRAAASRAARLVLIVPRARHARSYEKLAGPEISMLRSPRYDPRIDARAGAGWSQVRWTAEQRSWPLRCSRLAIDTTARPLSAASAYRTGLRTCDGDTLEILDLRCQHASP